MMVSMFRRRTLGSGSLPPIEPRIGSWGLAAPVVLVALLGSALAGAAFSWQAGDQQRNAAATAESAAETTAGYASESFADFESTLLSTVSLFNTLGDPTERQFAEFTEPIIDKRPDVKAIQFSRWITTGQRAAFEAELERAGHEDGIRDPTPDGLVAAADRDFYVPIRYNSPAAGNEGAYGLDIAYRPAALAAILAARRTGNPQLGGRIVLAQGGGTQEALTVYAPVYRGPEPTDTEQRIARFHGIVGIVMLLDGFAVAGSDALVDLALLSPGVDGAQTEVLWTSPGAEGRDFAELSSWSVTKTVRAPGRQLLLVGQPSEQLVVSLGPWRPWAIAGTVVLVAVLLTALTWKWIDARRFRDLAEQLDRASSRLRFLAERDPLTGLPHREGLRKWFDATTAAEPPPRLALLFIDLDAFKDINTVWGHPTGDTILRETGRHLAEAFLGDGGTAVRLGGDEFVVAGAASYGADESVDRMGRQVQAAINSPVQVDGREFLLTASIGAVVFPDDGSDLETLLARADLAVRRAKADARGEIRRYRPHMSEQAQSRERLVNALRRDARRPDEHFQLVYQPQVDITTGAVVGLEALLRWNNHETGWVSPDDFIPIAEQYGIMAGLGDWVLGTACEQYARWIRCGIELGQASVNVTAQQLLSPEFPQRLTDLLDTHPELRQRLEIEITEGTAMGVVDLGLLQRVRDTGVGIAIDDFGTGFSSLARLTEVPSQRVKIDRRFITRMIVSPEALEVVRAIVRMAGALELATVAEGVERPGQAEILAQEGVSVVQGFLYSRPLPAYAVPGALRAALVVADREHQGEGAGGGEVPTLRR